MFFCVNCDNMYYVKLSDDQGKELVYYCRNCGHENSEIGKKNMFVSKTVFKTVDNNYSNIINKYTKYDPTLPRVTNVECTNKECPSKKDGSKNEIILIRYDDKNLKYVNLCPICDNIWKN
jgi:DNA-directed RNA polymerase subunit M/transcription elongation factor TFIIS